MASRYVMAPNREEQWEVNNGETVCCDDCGRELYYNDPDYEDDDIIEYDRNIFCPECWLKYSLENFRYEG